MSAELIEPLIEYIAPVALVIVAFYFTFGRKKILKKK